METIDNINSVHDIAAEFDFGSGSRTFAHSEVRQSLAALTKTITKAILFSLTGTT